MNNTFLNIDEDTPCNSSVFTNQILTDTPFETVIKYIINGEIDEPIIALDTKGLLGSTIDSAYDFIGWDIPKLPSITEFTSKFTNKRCTDICNKSKEIQKGNQSLNYNYPSGIITNEISDLNSINIPSIDDINAINEIHENTLLEISQKQDLLFLNTNNANSYCKPFNYSSHDLVTFLPTPNLNYPLDMNPIYLNNNSSAFFLGLANNFSNKKSLKTQIITNIQNKKSLKVKLLDKTSYFDAEKNVVKNLYTKKISILFKLEFYKIYYSWVAIQILQLN